MPRFKVLQGKRYQATISLNFAERFVASNDLIKGKFEGVGFTDVIVRGNGGTRDAQGTWSQPDAEADLPSQVVPESVKEVPPSPGSQ